VTRGSRDVALDVLRRVFTQGAFASVLLRNVFDQSPDLAPSDRALATELVYGVLRRRGHLDRAIGRAAGKRLKDLDPRLHDVLRIGAYQLMFLDRIPDHAAVSEAVDQAKGRLGPRGGNQVNAILRKLASTPETERLPPLPDLERGPARHVQEAGGVPLALAELLVRDLGADRALAFVQASLQAAPLTLRTNRLRTTRDALAKEVGGEPGLHPLSVRLAAGAGVLPADLLAVAEGRATPQDEASMRVVDLLAPEPGERVLDVCSAPGGKTTMIAETMNDRGTIIAFDRLPERLTRVRSQAERLGLRSIETRDILPRPDDDPFDRVLVDAPCSGLGTLRRHPEIRWRFEPEQLDSLGRVQRSVLEEGARRTKIGGVLVYSVCTVTRAEGEERVAELDAFERLETIETSPSDPGGPDGFFAAKLIRRR
jgi:16S rRNA (cytosine967-C5)-methyltransferase